jgi:hypothetical protein
MFTRLNGFTLKNNKMKNLPIFRVILFVFVLVVVLVLPWWISVVVLMGLTIYLPFYPEVLFFGFLFDTLYGRNQTGLISATILLIITMFVRTRIRM